MTVEKLQYVLVSMSLLHCVSVLGHFKLLWCVVFVEDIKIDLYTYQQSVTFVNIYVVNICVCMVYCILIFFMGVVCGLWCACKDVSDKNDKP